MERTPHPYIIEGGQQGADRLTILASAMWPYTEPLLHKAGLHAGMTCLDVGCGNGEITRRLADIVGREGHVTGIDFDPAVIQIARQQASAYTNVHFEVLNIEIDTPEQGAYDFIYSRFLLSHLQSPLAALRKLYLALKLHGILVVEDVDFTGHFSIPESAAFQQYVQWYTETGLRKGANPNIGPILGELMADAGLKNIHTTNVTPSFRDGDGKQLAVLTLNAIRGGIVAEGLATDDQVDAVLRELIEFTKDTTSTMSLPRIFQVYGMKPQ